MAEKKYSKPSPGRMTAERALTLAQEYRESAKLELAAGQKLEARRSLKEARTLMAYARSHEEDNDDPN